LPELRKIPSRDAGSIIHDRGKRPHDFVRGERCHIQRQHGLFAPSARATKGKTPKEILAYGRNGGGKDTPGWTVRRGSHKFPALASKEGLDREGEGLFDRMMESAAHEVIIGIAGSSEDASR